MINIERKDKMETLQKTALILTIIGALNWGLIGVFEFDLVASLFGGMNTALARIVYALIGLAGLINIGLLFAEEPTRK